MEVIKNLFKHKVFFTKRTEYSDYSERRTVKRSTLYKSNIKYNHDEINITNKEELLNYIKPFLYYLGSKDVD